MDALKSLTFLTDHIPTWLAKVDDLSEYTARRQAEFAAEYTKLTHPKTRKQKAGSLHSIRSSFGNKDEPQAPASSTAAEPVHPELNPLDVSNRYLFANARRRRKNAGTSVRSGASGPSKYRSRHMVVVYYDSSVQENFEHLVRVIGGARNNLRKGKMAQVMKNGLQLPSLSGYTAPFSSFSVSPIDFKASLKGPLDPAKQAAAAEKKKDTGAFDRADKDLEAAQSLCEVGAHQFLRDGDCSPEIEGTKAKLQRVLELAKVEKQRLEEEDKLAKEMAEAEKVVAEAEELERRRSLEHSKPPVISLGNGDIEIEVDDSDSVESVEVDLSAFRATRARPRV